MTLPAHLHGTFDLVVVDPPFIVREVWEKYADAVKLLIKTGPAKEDGSPAGKVILTTVIENAPLLNELLGASPTVGYYYPLFFNLNRFLFASSVALWFSSHYSLTHSLYCILHGSV